MSFDRSGTCEVAIVGGGPVGLFLSCELGARGISTTVLEQSPGLVAHPKANTHNARSMEIYRRHGLSSRLREAGLPMDRPTDVAYFSRLLGRELHRVALPSPAAAIDELKQADTRWPTAEPQLRATQMALEPLLLERARSFGSVDVRFGQKVTGLEICADGPILALTAENGASSSQLKARYIVGCDGGRSLVRRELGINFMGREGLQMDFLGGSMQATYFRAPQLLNRFPHAPTWMNWTMHPQGRAILVLIDPDKDEFLMHFQLPPDQPAPEFGARLAGALGEPIEHEVISSAEWRAGIGVVAERYLDGPVFLAGDAAHLFTPTGGFGLNTGIEDAFNLGWKLALACRGAAGPRLLESYESERRPIAVRNTGYALELAASNGKCPVSPALDEESPQGNEARQQVAAHLAQFARSEFDTPGIQLGGRYDGSPIIVPHQADIPVDLPSEYTPCAAPGGRLPHCWLADDESLFDRLGEDFTLLSLLPNEDFSGWTEAGHALGVDLAILAISGDATNRALYGADLLLVRPDHYVAWRGDYGTEPRAILRHALGFIG
jgi:2-polyprenyl-6-methoxyphenol hydroxylase-like FAD-dependent oxidoreductase